MLVRKLATCLSCSTAKFWCYSEVRLLSASVTPTAQQFPDLKRGSYANILEADLNHFRGILGNDRVVTDSSVLEGYNTDWMKMYKGKSEVVLRPKSTEEVSAILQHCYGRRLAVCPQAGNTGLVGGSVPVFDEVILSTSLMNKIINFDTTAGILQCESGCILETLDQYANEHGFMIPIDLGAKGSCQIGGNISTNAGGVRFLRYGSLHGNVLGLEVVLSNGEVLDFMSALKKDNTGYDLKQLFIGAEGTLGIVTKAVIQCPPKPKSLKVAFLGCSSFDEVLKIFRLARQSLSEVLSSFEVMDHQSVEPLEKYYNIRPPIKTCKFYLLLEVTGSNEEHDEAKLNSFLEKVMSLGHVEDGTVSTSLSAAKDLWSIREHITPALQQYGYVHKHDLCLPTEHFYSVVEVMRSRLKDVQSSVCCGFGHLGDSNVHLNVVIRDPRDVTKADEIIYPFLYKWVTDRGGTISAEHGVGLRKKVALSAFKLPSTLDYMRVTKQCFDPKAILNPYKMI